MEMLTSCVGDYETNCYILWQEDSCILVDPGYEPEQILQQVQARGKTVAAVLLTHGHFDHVTGVKTIADRTGCPVYIHPAESQLPPSHTSGALYYTHHYQEGEQLELAGMQLQVLHTPGHTPGSVCLLCGDRMFSGDTLFAGTCGRTDFYPYGNPAQMRQSLDRLKNLPGDYRVFPGHGPATTLEQERRSNPYMQSL